MRHNAGDDEPAARDTELGPDDSKRITSDRALAIELSATRISPDTGSPGVGRNNLELSFKRSFFESEEHETIFSAGLGVEVGGTGAKSVGAKSFGTFTPTIFFGKGSCDLPDWMALLKPFAVIARVGMALPSRASTRMGDEIEQHRRELVTGLGVEHNFHYLQSYARNVGLRAPCDRMIPRIEFSAETPLD